MQKLGLNSGGYRGVRIEIQSVLRDAEAAARRHGWSSEIFHESGGFGWLAFNRKPEAGNGKPAARIYISCGIHGDEPAGPLAALRLLDENRWPARAEIFLLPCLNPPGFASNRRENPDGLDLNRDYRDPKSAEVRAHIAWLERQPVFDFYLCLHEDWEAQGFYLYEQNPDGKASFAEKIIRRVEKVCPVDLSDSIEGRLARGGIIRPVLNPAERADWPEAFYLVARKSRLGCTLEAPSDFPPGARVDALVAAVNAALETV